LGLLYADRLREARETFEAYRSAAVDRGSEGALSVALNSLANVELRAGRWRRAVR
jgi:hypothetical protein